MNLGRCPVCHSHISLEAIVQDDAGRELLALLAALDADLARPLVSYLGLFRPPKQDLRNLRALQLARDVQALAEPGPRLAMALAETVESLRAKAGPPLKNHNYLRRVLEGTPEQPAAGLMPRTTPGGRASKTAAAYAALELMK